VTHYNVWRADKDRWANVLEPLDLENEKGNPQKLSYRSARRVVEHSRSKGWPGYEVRERLDDGTSDKIAVGYNAWMVDNGKKRWTVARLDAFGNRTDDQNQNIPDILSLKQAEAVVAHLIKSCGMSEKYVQVMEIDSNLSFCDIGACSNVPPPLPTPEPVLTRAQQGLGPVEEMNWKIYNGFEKPDPVNQVKHLIKIDPYTGLPKGNAGLPKNK
jgi:hypothetical protein